MAWTPNLIEISYRPLGATPPGAAPLAVVWGHAQTAGPDEIWVAGRYNLDTEQYELMTVVTRAQFVAGRWLRTDREYEWPE